MVRSGFRHVSGSRLVVFGLIASVTALTISTTPADAARRHRKPVAHHTKAVRYAPPYSAIVVDANSGKILHEASADALRHPASLTKIMTLYLLFERLEAGKIKLNSELNVTAHAAAQAPSKLGLRPGQTIRVEDAIRAVVTKSANDVAVVIAENLGGDEPTFSRMMTKKARALGMRQTVYLNASGLPNSGQITSARDQATLGRAIQDRFPEYYAYFSTHTFTYKGQAMRNHNHLLGNVEGVDGIKTGYVQASGFNLVTSVRRNGRHLVAVVMGGRTAGARDARMRELISGNIQLAAARRTAPPIMEASETAPVAVASAAENIPLPRAATREPAIRQVAEQPAAGDSAADGAMTYGSTEIAATSSGGADANDDLKPIAVKTVKVKASSLLNSPIGSIAARSGPIQLAPETTAHVRAEESIAVVASAAPGTGSAMGSAIGSGISGGAAAPTATPRTLAPQTLGSQARALQATAPATPAPIVTASVTDRAIASIPASSGPAHGWMIQVGALETQKDADERLQTARSKAKTLLAKAKAFTEAIVKHDMKLYRARFANISKDDAESACKTLKSAKMVCIALKN